MRLSINQPIQHLTWEESSLPPRTWAPWWAAAGDSGTQTAPPPYPPPAHQQGSIMLQRGIISDQRASGTQNDKSTRPYSPAKFKLLTQLIRKYRCCGSGSVGSVCFGPPGSRSGSINQMYGSDSLYNQTKIVRKTLIPTVFLLLFDFYLWKIM